MGSELVRKAEWLGGRDRLKLTATARVVLNHMARLALDNGGTGVGDERQYGQTKDGKPAQLFTQAQATAIDEVGMCARMYMQQIARLESCGVLERVDKSAPGRSRSFRLHVAEMYDAYKRKEELKTDRARAGATN
ncbi:hypothetical protein Uis1B_0197 [Bifidobacterium margollesii]|uniref:Uncharacterized protein n=1 Tax=Bifidobacterium margollesii TaxID=2020964 RepID=A0A2N5JD15_9BIFI|nr:hypothetical protein [Bifidobacterium margollesii]PLS32104.1 hypothetical protein Uis1B_0197 [Bifidobacterium margollesii]